MAAKVSKLYKLLDKLDGKEFMESYIAYNSALVNALVKPSVTLTIKKKAENKVFRLWKVYGEQCLEELKLKSVILREGEDYIILLIYSEILLSEFINKEENREFLETLGYNLDLNLNAIIGKLVERYNIYKCPHELGIFLGYPIEDVKGFINCSREKCIFCGYWKVYSNEKKARQTFLMFDKIKEITITNLTEGKRAREIVRFFESEYSFSM